MSTPASTDPQTRRLCVAIDGPAGAGKSTVSRRLAERLGYVLLDTGALYRTVALMASRAGLAWEDPDGIGALAGALASGDRLRLERGEVSALGGSGVRVLVDGEDISAAIRAPEVSVGASRVSSIPAVRAALLEAQRSVGRQGGVVAEGRDIGTVVFPQAEVKFFLTASPEVRARRRYDELQARGLAASFEATLAEVIERDRADTERAVAPLRRAEDALLIDSSSAGAEELVESMARVVEERACR